METGLSEVHAWTCNFCFVLFVCLFFFWYKFKSILNHLTPKIWLLILPSGCYTFPCKLVTGIWYLIRVMTFALYVWLFSLPVLLEMFGNYREKLHDNQFYRVKVLTHKNEQLIISPYIITHKLKSQE